MKKIRLDKEALHEKAHSLGHLRQDDIAEHAGIGRSALSRLLQGLYPPKIETLVALRDAYGFPDLDSLLIGADRSDQLEPVVPAQHKRDAA